VTLFDREIDERNFWKIIEYYDMKSSIKKLKRGDTQISDLLDEINKDGLY
jgi:actin-related protein